MTDTILSEAPGADVVNSPEGSTWARLRVIIESLADGIVIVDRAGAIRFANPAAGRLFNRSPSALVGSVLGTPLVAGETTEMEVVARHGAEVVHAELRVVSTEWEGGPAQLVSLRDVTDRKFAEERTRQLAHEREARLQAEAASRTKSDFLAIMSHELRTPLNAILGYSELIESGLSGDISDKTRDQIVRIRVSARHLLGLVNDILDLAKVEAGQLSIANTPASARDAVLSSLTLIQPQAAARNISIVVTHGADLPPYIGDAERARQILVNLLSNATKCTEPGGTITVESIVTSAPDSSAQLEQRSAYIRVSVGDTGSGIPPDKLAEIFEPFMQVDSGTRRTREGSGLGLTIAQRLARAMGGDLTVNSTVGVGSTFHLYLPVDPAAVLEAQRTNVPATEDEDGGERRTSRTAEKLGDLTGLCEVSHGMLANLEPLVSTVVERIRSDPTLRVAAGLRTAQVTDHLHTLLADIAGALIIVEQVAGEPSPLLSDAMEIQRLIAERHGSQRAQLGWTEGSMRREFMIIREEVERIVRASVPAGGPLVAADAVATVSRFVDQAEYIGVRVLNKEREG